MAKSAVRCPFAPRPLLALVAIVVFAWILRAQQTPWSYRDVAADYFRNPAQGLGELAALSNEAIDEGIASALAGWTENEVRAAACMHTDAWLRELRPFTASEWAGIPKRNIASAARLFNHTVSTAEGQWVAYRWYEAVIVAVANVRPSETSVTVDSSGHATTIPPPAEELASQLTDGFGEQPFLRAASLFDRALGEESDALVGFFRGTARRGSTEYDTPPLRDAATDYEAALQAMPDMTLAALHLGRIRMLQDRMEDARRLLDMAAGSRVRSTRYVAALLLGSMAEREGRFDEAEDRYRGALLMVPRGQSALMALAQLHSRAGRPDDSRRMLDTILSGSDRVPPVDPWWSYLPDTSWKDPASTMNALRYEILR